MRGDADAAFMWLERAYAQRDGGTVYIKVLPFHHLVKDDARYLPFLKKWGWMVNLNLFSALFGAIISAYFDRWRRRCKLY